ncbi:hypothetical protein QJS10_CPA05g00635 [Acorus calamus]|uniref:Uncharacterized protein n=1 Tax=Acorus calamus TaxID=4465 RepID=A0AAV9F0C9_ACOCL|nr:hypothetical protein QJS10_CPA05g00635 [Acorus calamus]
MTWHSSIELKCDFVFVKLHRESPFIASSASALVEEVPLVPRNPTLVESSQMLKIEFVNPEGRVLVLWPLGTSVLQTLAEHEVEPDRLGEPIVSSAVLELSQTWRIEKQENKRVL